MAVSITTLAALIASGEWSYDGYGGGDWGACASNTNSGAFRYSGASYIVLVDDATLNRLQVYKSTDDITWSTYGSPLVTTYSPDGNGNLGPCSLLIGNHLYVAFTPASNDGTQPDLVIALFDLDTATWGTSLTYAMPTNHGPILPMYMGERPDGSIVIVLSGNNLLTDFSSPLVAMVLSSGSFTPYVIAPAVNYNFVSAAMDGSGNLEIFYEYDPTSDYYQQSFSSANSVGSAAVLPFSSSLAGLFGNAGTGFGCYSGADLYVPILTTSGDLEMARYASGTWTVSASLFSFGFGIFNGLPPSLFIIGSTMICVASNVAGGIKIAVGYVPLASAMTPAAWTWARVYDGASPSPAVTGATAPYLASGRGGIALIVNSITGGDIRVTMTARNSSPGVGVFTALICRIAVTGGVTLIFNEFE